MSRASRRVGPSLAQPRHQHVAGARGDGEERVIAPLAGVVVATGSFLRQSIGLADGGVQVHGQRPVAGSPTGGPSPGQQLPTHPIQLAHMPPPEAAQEGPQGGRRLDHAAQHPRRTAGAQHIGVVNAVATGQRRRHQRQHLVASVGSARDTAQVDVAVHQFPHSQVMGQRDRKQQSGIGHQAVVVEGDVDAVRLLRW